jgi:hypothetical protein
MIIQTISPEQLERAEELYSFGQLHNSIMEGQSNIYGAIGEILVNDYYEDLGFEVEIIGSYDYDLLINGKKIDVKSKKTTVSPLPHYNCSVAAFNTTQKCHGYFFTRIHEKKKYGYLLGMRSKKAFYEEATFNRQGEIDKSSQFGWKFRADCYNLEISKLKGPPVKEE